MKNLFSLKLKKKTPPAATPIFIINVLFFEICDPENKHKSSSTYRQRCQTGGPRAKTGPLDEFFKKSENKLISMKTKEKNFLLANDCGYRYRLITENKRSDNIDISDIGKTLISDIL